MVMKLRWDKILVLVLLMAVLSGCASHQQTSEIEKEKVKREKHVKSEPSIPILELSDALSSTDSCFKVEAGTYSWNYKNGNDISGLVACGFHPLESAQLPHTATLEIPEYNRMEKVSYMLSCQVKPDVLKVCKWDAADIGNSKAAIRSKDVYREPIFLVELEPGYVYEFTAAWKKENLEGNGFYGEANYVFVTESKGK